ncbi:aldo-keto reductase Mvan_2161-like [Leptinotarsa decemlineata]|uniref:aldo-keto reductase Mvan_2161-like n=1 Tax=Leptinotarsa decemlineata TaxID=7539 RepID=UPI003D30B6B5
MAFALYSLNSYVYFLLLCSSVFEVSCLETSVPTKYMKFHLNTGDIMPAIGFGTYLIEGTELIHNVLDLALSVGYRLIDTAAFHENEEDIGKALKVLLPKHNLTRKDIFITTKLYPGTGAEKAYEALEQSLKYLDCEYIDLYLMHWPGADRENLSKSEVEKWRSSVWQQLVRGKRNGLTRNIGVSNFNLDQLKELLANDHGVKPAVNQIEWNPNYHPDEVVAFCIVEEGIVVQGYSSLGGTSNQDLLDHPEVKKIAEKLGKTPAQILLRWSLQQNLAIIPKARSKEHMEQNIDLNFNIPEADMSILSNFERKKHDWDPDTVA